MTNRYSVKAWQQLSSSCYEKLFFLSEMELLSRLGLGLGRALCHLYIIRAMITPLHYLRHAVTFTLLSTAVHSGLEERSSFWQIGYYQNNTLKNKMLN